ncbi:MAG: phosphoribosylglycinamide formyltransferase [Candidatus Kaelpia aquatica]|nr:phosphoribosylglycinamide formyltransferase [Candidatus Kaelpia aquatica]
MERFAVFVSGNGSNLEAIIEAIGNGKIEAKLSLVVSDNASAYALKRAAKAGIERFCFDPKDYCKREDYEALIIKELKEKGVDFIVLAGFMRILSSYFVNRYKNKILNIHPALLPSFPGAHAVRDTLRSGADQTGVTVHFVNEGVDSGPIIVQDIEPIRVDDTEETLTERLHKIEHKLYPEVIDLFAKEKILVEDRAVKIIIKGEQDEN